MNKQRVYYYEDDILKIKVSTARYRFCLPFLNDKFVLDVGCGARQGPEILSTVSRKVIGSDISFEAISYCQNQYGRKPILYLVSDAMRLPFKDKAFDAVVSFEVIEHLKDQMNFLTQLRRVLKKEGTCYISTPNRIVSSPFQVLSNPDHVREYDLKEFRDLLLNFFPEVKIYGQFASEGVRKIEDIRKDNLKIAKRFPHFAKKMLSPRLKDAFLNFFHRSRAEMSGLDVKAISEEDFFFSEVDVEEARYFFAVCENSA